MGRGRLKKKIFQFIETNNLKKSVKILDYKKKSLSVYKTS